MLISLLVTITALVLLSRFVSRALGELLGSGWYVVLLWPGVIVHELSHALGCLLTLTRVYGFTVYPQGPNTATLGEVSHAATSNPLKLIVISVMPVIGGGVVLGALAQWLLPVVPIPPTLIVDATFAGRLVDYILASVEFIRQMAASFSVYQWQHWLFLYFALALSAHLAPSSTDLKHTARGILGILVVVVALILIGLFFQIPLTQRVAEIIAPVLAWVLAPLSFALVTLVYTALVSAGLLLIKRLIR